MTAAGPHPGPWWVQTAPCGCVVAVSETTEGRDRLGDSHGYAWQLVGAESWTPDNPWPCDRHR